MTKLLATTDLHQHPRKWKLLVKVATDEKPDTLLIAGDILPKYGGFAKQREFFPELRGLLTRVRNESGSQVLLYLCNDDAHYLEPLVDELEADGLCINMAQRVYRADGLVYCGMNRVRDYPFGYKHYCVPDGDWVVDPVQFTMPNGPGRALSVGLGICMVTATAICNHSGRAWMWEWTPGSFVPSASRRSGRGWTWLPRISLKADDVGKGTATPA